MAALSTKTIVYASGPSALNLMDKALIGVKALERGGDLQEALSHIEGVEAANDPDGGTSFTLGDVPSHAVNSGPIDVSFDTSSMKLTLDEDAGPTVRSMLDSALSSEGIASSGGKPAPTMKR